MRITDIIELLQTDEFVGVSQEVEIAKGKHARIRSFKQALNQLRRFAYVRKNKI